MTLPENRWTGARIGRLGFLMGLGWDGARIAADPLIHSTTNNVHRQAQRFGLSFRTATSMSFAMTPEAAAFFDTAAAKRGLMRESLVRLLLLEIAGDPNLLDNILDDGVKSAA